MWNEELNAHMQRGLWQWPYIQQFMLKPPGQAATSPRQDSGVDDCVTKGSGKELANLSKSVDAK